MEVGYKFYMNGSGIEMYIQTSNWHTHIPFSCSQRDFQYRFLLQYTVPMWYHCIFMNTETNNIHLNIAVLRFEDCLIVL